MGFKVAPITPTASPRDVLQASGTPDLLDGGVPCTVGQAAEDAPLGHLQAGSHWGDPGQHGRQAGDVRLHVTQQLLQLVQDCGAGVWGVEKPPGPGLMHY